MILAVVLALLGVPLWLCVLAILIVLYRIRSLRQRPGNIPVRVQRPGKTRWARGHAVWVSDVFAWRAVPASWKEDLLHVLGVHVESLEPEDLRKLRRLGDNPTVATLTADGREPVRVAVAA